MNANFQLHRYEDAAVLADGLSTVLLDACTNIEQPSLALAGGRTPFPAYRALAHSLGETRHLRVLPTDDRCVPHDQPASNLLGLREAFGASADCIAITAQNGGEAASLAIAMHTLATLDDFDAVLLGMGGDGHFASLFPGATNLDSGLALHATADAILTTPEPLPPEAPFARISLTLPRLLRTRQLHLCITGAQKLDVLTQASSQPSDLPYPVAALLRAADSRLHVHWSP